MSTEQRIGTVTNYAPKPQAAIVELEAGKVRVGDTIHIKGPTVDLFEKVSSIHFERRPVEEAVEGQRVGIRVSSEVPDRADVFLVHGDVEQEEIDEADAEDVDEERERARQALKRRELRRQAEEGRTEVKRLNEKRADPDLAKKMHDFWG